MPVRRRRDKHRRELISSAVGSLLNDEAPPEGSAEESLEIFLLRHSGGELGALWQQNGGEVVARWAVRRPGTRPSLWWRFEAPEPRRRLGGVGMPRSDVLADAPWLEFGISVAWCTPWEADYYTGRARDVDGNPIGQEYAGQDFPGVAVDPADPPRFEAQAAFLRRLDLLLPGELQRLSASDFEPERLDFSDDADD